MALSLGEQVRKVRGFLVGEHVAYRHAVLVAVDTGEILLKQHGKIVAQFVSSRATVEQPSEHRLVGGMLHRGKGCVTAGVEGR